MRVTVSREVCEGHGQCEFAAPGVFEIGEDGAAHVEPEPPAHTWPSIEKAAAVCPVGAIQLDRAAT